MRSGLRITAATTTGPAQGPRPASSMPTIGPRNWSISSASRSKVGRVRGVEPCLATPMETKSCQARSLWQPKGSLLWKTLELWTPIFLSFRDGRCPDHHDCIRARLRHARQEAGHDELVGIWRIVEAKASAADLY